MEITESILMFRENIRHIWNTTGRNLIFSDYRFGEIEWRLFKNTVLTEAEPSIMDEELAEYYKSIKVIPTFEWSNSKFLYSFRVGNNYTWQEVTLFIKNELDLRFMEFYDFNLQGFKEYRYARVRVMGAVGCDEIIGSDLLIEAVCCKYYNVANL